jgi:hypothetical protein
MCTVPDNTLELNNICVIGGNNSPRRLQLRDQLAIGHVIYTNMGSTHHPCYQCPEIRLLNRPLKLVTDTNLLIFEVTDNAVRPEAMLSIDSVSGSRKIYTLRGLIYHGSGHFTSRLVDGQGQVWYNDSAINRSQCVMEGNLNASSDTNWLKTAHGRTLAYVVYAV